MVLDKQRIRIQSVNCPLCKSSRKKSLYRDLYDVEESVPGKYTISECLSCQLVYLSVRPVRSSLQYCYPQDYHVRVEKQRSWISKFLYSLKHKHDYLLLNRIIGRIPASLLDIGFGSGGLLLELQRLWGKKCRLAGIELTAPISDELSHAGIRLFIGSLEKIAPSERFEVITMNEILEHVYDPVQALQAASKWLVKGGILVGEVPHFQSLWRKVFGKYWQGFHTPRHMTFFDENTMKKVLSAGGFKILSTGNRFNPGDIGVSLCNFLINKLFPNTRSRQSLLYIPLIILTAPLSYVLYKFLNSPQILEFSAVKK